MQQGSKLRTVILNAVAATSLDVPNQHLGLFAQATLPVFSTPEPLGIEEGVAIVYRNTDGLPIHGGFFSVTAENEVVKLVLVDSENKVNTDDNPAWTAFGMMLSIGKLLVRDGGFSRELPWSIVDLYAAKPNEELHAPSEVRLRVRDAYLGQIVPMIASVH